MTCLQFAAKHVFFSGAVPAWAPCLVTSSITHYVIITMRKPSLFTFLQSPIMHFSANLLDSLNIKLCKIEMGDGKFVLRNLLAKQNAKQICLFCSLIDFLAMKNHTRQKGRVNCDLHSPDTLDTCLGERASANVQPCISTRLLPSPLFIEAFYF